MNYLPHRYRRSSVDRFVPVIEQLLRRGGTPVSFDPSDLGINVETALARFRDAVHALSTGLVTHPNINAILLQETWLRFKATSDGTRVLLLSRKAEQGPPQLTAVPVSEGRVPLATLRSTQPRFVDSLTALAVLLGQRILVGEVVIHGEITDTLKQRLESENDVAFRQEAQNTTIML